MAKVDTDKFIALLIETYCRRMGIITTEEVWKEWCRDYEEACQ